MIKRQIKPLPCLTSIRVYQRNYKLISIGAIQKVSMNEIVA